MIMIEDSRGPVRKIVAIEKNAGFTLVTFDCGHQSHMNQIFTYHVGEDCRCFWCGPEGVRKPEIATWYANNRATHARQGADNESI